MERLAELSRADANHILTRLTGSPLPAAPGERPKRRKGQAGVTRMIDAQQIDQLHRLLGDCFSTPHARQLWLTRNFKVAVIKDLATAKRAGQVIRVLKLMKSRKESPSVPRP